MANCAIRWRSSGGRGEFEFVPSDSLTDKNISVYFEGLDVIIPAEVRGVKANGKPRLRKFTSNDRKKLHLPQLVMAVARLPEPAREDNGSPIHFPLENKSFVMDEMTFEIQEDNFDSVTLIPLKVSIRRSDFIVNLQDRLTYIKDDWDNVEKFRHNYIEVYDAINAHRISVQNGENSSKIRETANIFIEKSVQHFGYTNVSSIKELVEIESKPEVDIEEIVGKEGKILTRVHSYKERDRKFSQTVRKHFRNINNGFLHCMACGLQPNKMYKGVDAERCIEAHHKIPIEELQPDSITRVEDMVMVCSNCHRIIHSKKPCLTIDEVKKIICDIL